MKTSQLIVMWVGIVLLFLTWMKPPILMVTPMFPQLNVVIDWPQLAIFDLMIITPTIGIILTLGSRC